MKFFLKSVMVFLLAASPVFAGLKWEQTEVSADAAPGEKIVKLHYTFTNTGETPVEIKKVRAGCSCTKVEVPKTIYQPGEKGELVALFEIGKRTGLQKKKVTVYTSDEAEEILHFTVKIP